MQKLLNNDKTLKFQKCLTERMEQCERFDLLPVCGFLCQMHEFDGNVFVDSLDARKVSLICLMFKDPKPHNQPCDQENISFHIWCKSIETINWSYVNEFLELFNMIPLQCFLLSTEYSIVQALISRSYFQQRNISLQTYAKAHVAYVKRSNFKSYPCPEGFYIKQLTDADTIHAMDNYKFGREPHVRSRMLGLSSLGKSIGVYKDDTNELVSWVFLNWDCTLSALVTKEGWGRRGLGLAAISAISESSFKQGFPVLCVIERDVPTTDDSLYFFMKFGFTCRKDVTLSYSKVL